MKARKKPRTKAAANPLDRVRTQHKTLLDALQSIKEEELTTQVLQPLLVALGYKSVDYHGGPYEEGKDLICQKTDEFGDPALTVVQVKRYRATVAARKGAGDTFSELVTQLAQAAEKSIPTLNGPVLPSQVLLITPYPINTRSLQSRFERYEELRHRKLKILDGTKLADLLLQHLPEVASRYGASGDVVAALMDEQLTNLPLMNALCSETRKPISQFYTDIDFSLGRWTTKLFLTSNFTWVKDRKLELRRLSWESLWRVNESCRSFFGVIFLKEAYEDVVSRAEEEHAASLEKRDLIEEHRACLARRDECVQELDNLIKSLYAVYIEKSSARKAASTELEYALDEQEKLRAQLSTKREDRIILEEVKHAEQRVATAKAQLDALRLATPYHPNDLRVIQSVVLRSPASLGRFDQSGRAYPKSFADQWAKWSNVCQSASKDMETEDACLHRVMKDMVSASRDESELRNRLGEAANFSDHICYRPTIDTEELSHVLTERRNALREEICHLNKVPPSMQQLRKFLEECQPLFVATNEILGDEFVADAVGVLEGTRYLQRESDEFRLSISVQDVFATGVNLAVLGEAGAGKTTALQMYARHLIAEGGSDCICFFIPLARMVNAWRSVPQEPASECSQLERAIVAFTQRLGCHLTMTSLAEICRRRKTVFLFDGIDEAINAAPWLLKEMKEFSERYRKAQVVTSSRMMGDYLERIPFLGVTLRDFTEEQQQQFFRLYFSGEGETKTADLVLSHLRCNSEIREVVRSPLLATVMCEIAAKGGSLPRSEARLFEDRVELLTGRFDQFKDVRRIQVRREDLLYVARKLAYWLQESEQRDEDRQVLYVVADERAKNRLGRSKACSVVDELVDPCELLVPMTEDGRLGFGHRRYQEHLAAYELARQQWVKIIIPLLGVPWWRSVFEFYSRMEETLDEFMAFVSAVGLDRKYRQTLERMIAVRPQSERARLQGIVQGRGAKTGHPSDIEELVRLSHRFNDEVLDDWGREESELIEQSYSGLSTDDEEDSLWWD
jgi:hypothetical protein